jgi:tRNA(adenine34) deaminase
MQLALLEARAAALRGEVPVGAVLTDASGAVVAAAGNRVEALADPTAHAEMLVLRAARARLGGKFLPGCTLTVTLEPCPLCAAALALFRIKRVVFGAYDPKSGGIEHGPRVFQHPTCPHRPEVIGGVEERASMARFEAVFAERRDPANSAER